MNPIDEIKDTILQKDLIRHLVKTELKSNYKGKALGFIWMILDPLLTMGIYVLLISVIFKRGGPQFPVLLFASLISWKWFSISITNSLKAFVNYAKLITTIRVPLATFTVAKVFIAFANYIVSLGILVPMLFIFDAKFSLNLLWLPPIIIFQFIFTLGFSLIFSVLGTNFLDVHNIMQFVLRLWFYFSPALYSIELIPEKYRSLYLIINPIASLFESYKNILVYGTPPNIYLPLFVVEGILFLIVGLYMVRKNRSSIVKIL